MHTPDVKRWIAVATVLILTATACGPTETGDATAPSTGGAPQPTASPRATSPAVLIFDTETCRNQGTVDALGAVWELVDPVPLAWRKMGRQQGSLTVVKPQDAIFRAGDGTELRVTIGPHEEVCFGWHDTAGPPTVANSTFLGLGDTVPCANRI